MTDFNYVIDTRTGVKRRLMPGETMRDGEVLHMGMEGMHRPAALKLSDAAVAIFIRDGASKPDAVPAGFYRDSYGRLLATGTGPERDRVEGFRIARDAMLADAYKAGDAQPNAGRTREQYIADLADAWKRQEA